MEKYVTCLGSGELNMSEHSNRNVQLSAALSLLKFCATTSLMLISVRNCMVTYNKVNEKKLSSELEKQKTEDTSFDCRKSPQEQCTKRGHYHYRF